MWVNIKVVNEEYNIIYLPALTKEIYSQRMCINFGQKSEPTDVKKIDQFIHTGTGKSFNTPMTILMSTALKEKLLIVESVTYQLKIESNNIIIGPVIGLLLSNKNFLYKSDYMKKFSDRLSLYNKFGGLVYAFSTEGILWGKNEVYGLYYNFKKSDWYYNHFPLPTAIYNRSFRIKDEEIKRLILITGNRLFNSYRFNKYELYFYLSSDKQIRNHLIPTELTQNYVFLKEFLNKHRKIILKPTDLSRGRGICIIEKRNSTFYIEDYRCKEPQKVHLHNEDLLDEFFYSNSTFFSRYIMQKHIDLARVNGSVYDIRVVMQKHKAGSWNCTGIECRVASKGSLVTNISKGGEVLELNEALKKTYPEYSNFKLIQCQIYEFCKLLCTRLDRMGEHFGEFGIDIALDENKRLWLIEVNVLPGFKGFKKLNSNMYSNLRRIPILYAVSLTQFGDSLLDYCDKKSGVDVL